MYLEDADVFLYTTAPDANISDVLALYASMILTHATPNTASTALVTENAMDYQESVHVLLTTKAKTVP